MTLNDYQINTIRNLECEINIARAATNYFAANRDWTNATEFNQRLKHRQSWLSNYILIIMDRHND